MPARYLKDLAGYWAGEFDWRKQEAALNQHPQFTTEIDGQQMHFVHVRSARADATPLLLIHGWPGTPADFLAMIDPLANPRDPGMPAFHLVMPSLPGHGFSGPITEPGWNDGRVAAALAELMARLGYDRYGVRGGDHGAFLAPGSRDCRAVKTISSAAPAARKPHVEAECQPCTEALEKPYTRQNMPPDTAATPGMSSRAPGVLGCLPSSSAPPMSPMAAKTRLMYRHQRQDR